MEPKTINVKLSAALALILAGAGTAGGAWLSKPDMDEMMLAVDTYRAAQALQAAEAGQFRESAPVELAKELAVAAPGKRLLAGPACKTAVTGVICQVEDGVEVQIPLVKAAKLLPEVETMQAEYDAAVATKEAQLEAEREAKAAAAAEAAEAEAEVTP